MTMARSWIWWQLLIGWLPVWALYAGLIIAVHQPSSTWHAVFIAFRAVAAAALLGLVVHRFTQRFAWPRPFRVSFVALHLLAAITFAFSWITLSSLIESVAVGRLVIVLGGGFVPFLVLGIYMYVMVAGVSYATAATERAARAETAAARSQLEALRAQLHPHFLFNALHTVVQLIPREPERAAQAAEQVAGLLRTTLEQDRDVVSLADEWAFVSRYLDIERVRFGDRLRITSDLSDDALDAALPSFALQTLVENAVRHGAEPKVEPTTIAIHASLSGDTLTIVVRDDGAGATADSLRRDGATGIARLRERLTALYGAPARLTVEMPAGHGVTATLHIPQPHAADR